MFNAANYDEEKPQGLPSVHSDAEVFPLPDITEGSSPSTSTNQHSTTLHYVDEAAVDEVGRYGVLLDSRVRGLLYILTR